MTSEMSKNCRQKSRKNGFVSHSSYYNNLQSEHCSRQRRTEYGSKTGTDTHQYHYFMIAAMQTEQAGKLVGYGSPHLYSGTFTTGGSSEKMSQNRSDIYQRSHTERNNVTRRANFLYQKIIAFSCCTSPIMIHQTNNQSG